jgi:hypothetical protein
MLRRGRLTIRASREAFIAHDEKLVAIYLSVSADGDFDLQFDYDDPYKFGFRGASVR